MASAQFKLLGKYRTPAFCYGQRVEDQRRGQVRIVGLTAGRIPWPIGKTLRAKSLVLYRDLARAVRRESVIAIRYWFGVGLAAVGKWRKALGVPEKNEGTLARHVAHGKSKAGRKALVAMHATLHDPARAAKIGACRRGKRMSTQNRAALLKANLGRPLSAERRRKIGDAHKRLGTRPPWINPGWSAHEDRLLWSLPPREVAKRTGRTLTAVFSMRYKLGLTR